MRAMRLKILADGRPALTARMAVARYSEMYGLRERAIRSAVVRSGVAPIVDEDGRPPLYPTIPLYYADQLDKAMAEKYGS